MKLNDFQLYEIAGESYSLAELTEFVEMAKQQATAQRRQQESDDHCYYVAKAIAETFYCQEDDIDEMNDDAEFDGMYSVAGRYVTIDTRRNHREIVVETHYFDEFDESQNGRPKILSRVETIKDRVVGNYPATAKVFEMYCRYFEKDYACSFTYRENW